MQEFLGCPDFDGGRKLDFAATIVIGGRDGTKELIAIEDGDPESTESWATVLRGLKRRGMRAPVLAVGDGALSFWAALRDVWPETREQCCWMHRIANVLESPFATVLLRQRVTKGAGSRQKGLLMAFKLLAMAERGWRRINAPGLVPLVRVGVHFLDGAAMERTRAA